MLVTLGKTITRKVHVAPRQANIVEYTTALTTQKGETVDQRQLRAISIANNSRIIQDTGKWLVPSQSGPGHYSVGLNGTSRCTCPDFDTRGVKCKHIWAVEFTIERNSENGTRMVPGVQTPAKASQPLGQGWKAYNAAQTHEKDHFQVLLKDLCAGIPEPSRAKTGRRPLPISDLLFSAVFKVYSTVSGRRFMSDLRTAHAKGIIDKLPCHNSIFNALESEATTPILMNLITRSSLPLKSLESSFACDSSGFSASRFDRWFDHKHGKERIQRTWVKTHIMCGVKTNVVTAVEIHSPNANDSPFLPSLLTHTADNFNILEVSADLAYSSEKNLKAITSLGATPLIPFKDNATHKRGGLWAQMFYTYHHHRDRFMKRYNLRSNVETTFSMIKAKFGDSVRSKTNTSMKNEVLAKILCHNICCVIHSMYELGIDPGFWANGNPAQN